MRQIVIKRDRYTDNVKRDRQIDKDEQIDRQTVFDTKIRYRQIMNDSGDKQKDNDIGNSDRQ